MRIGKSLKGREGVKENIKGTLDDEGEYKKAKRD